MVTEGLDLVVVIHFKQFSLDQLAFDRLWLWMTIVPVILVIYHPITIKSDQFIIDASFIERSEVFLTIIV